MAVGLRHNSLRERTALPGLIARLRAVSGEKWRAMGRDGMKWKGREGKGERGSKGRKRKMKV